MTPSPAPASAPRTGALLGTSDKAAGRRKRFRIAAIMSSLNLSLFVVAMNQTLLASATPTITSDFDSAGGYVWIGGANLLATAASGPLWAKASDIWGRKSIIMLALLGFSAGTIVCALSVNMQMLIAGRVLQGVAGAGVMGQMTIVISDIFSMRERALFIATFEVVWAIAAALGPTLGGVFTEKLSWRYCFWLSLPFCGIATVILFVFLDVHNPRTSMRDGLKAVDWLGSLTLVGMVLMVLLGLDFGGVIFPWESPKVVCLIVFGVVFAMFFYFSEKRWAQYPVIPLAIFESMSNLASFLVCFFQGFVYMGAEYFLPLYFQAVKGMSPLRAGTLLVPSTVSEATAGIVASIFIHRTGRYLDLVWVGTILMTVGTGLYIQLGVDSSIAAIVGFQIIAGLGCGCLFTPPVIALQANVSQENTATASAAMGLSRNIATAMSVVIAGVVFQNGMTLRANDLESAGLAPALINQLAGDDAAANVLKVGNIADLLQQRAVRQAYSWSIRNLWIMFTCAAFLAVIASAFVKTHVLSHDHTETKTGIQKKGIGKEEPLEAPV
ncbi:putative MFS transporter [Lophiostoma macrostomum CBS 122681]|uniref:Putative MFS transporter n=1 Tax=Lophiostoma macrostomum CBS 122681 TaxID=1314788 RepID=A0A6A6TAN3_9PLEO|nr:putative MFS transporter [Lophiostoma macrostomum CBS 122681]